MSGLIIKALLFGVHFRAPDFWKNSCFLTVRAVGSFRTHLGVRCFVQAERSSYAVLAVPTQCSLGVESEALCSVIMFAGSMA